MTIDLTNMNETELKDLQTKVEKALKAASKKTQEAFRPGQAFGVDSEGNLRTLKLTESADAQKAEEEESIRVFESIGMTRKAAEFAAKGRY